MEAVVLPQPAATQLDDATLPETAFRRPGGVASLPAGAGLRLVGVLRAMPASAALELAAGFDDDGAVRFYKAWLGCGGAGPEAFAVWFNLGVALIRSGERAQAAIAYENALLLKPDLHEASINLGIALEGLGRTEEALRAWRRAIPSPDLRRVTHMHLGRVLEEAGRLEEAAAELQASLLVDPDQPDVQQHWLHARQRMAVWPVVEPLIPGLSVETLANNCGPLAAVALYDDPARQTAITAAWIARKVPAAPERLAPQKGYAHDRIRVGYMSSDFCRHAMSYLITEVLERHDRAAFEIFGYCASPEDGSDVRRRVIAAFDRFAPITALDDEAAARLIRADEIDVLVDLNGLTKGARLGVLRWKPAPVQATYLGYIGPVPVPELDWMICDAVAVPPELADQYRPRPLALPGCYQANDATELPRPPVSRAAEGLPEEAFVFCCFAPHYKITPALFEAWLTILERTPRGVLWIVDDNPASRRNLVERWAARGLAPERLIFAPRVDPARYRARMALGDLYLDTTPYNAGTVASDALRMGLPLLTLAGRAFAARMATSLLTRVGLPEGIAEDMEDYVARAVALAADPVRHAAYRARVGGDAWRRSLGDSRDFTRRLEDAYRRIRIGGSAGPRVETR